MAAAMHKARWYRAELTPFIEKGVFFFNSISQEITSYEIKALRGDRHAAEKKFVAEAKRE